MQRTPLLNRKPITKSILPINASLAFQQIGKLKTELENLKQEHIIALKNHYQEFSKILNDKIIEINTVIERIKGLQTIKGDKGEKPEVGVDYFVPKNGKDADENLIIEKVLLKLPNENEIIKNILSKIKIPKDGEDGKDAVINEEKIIKEVIKKVPKKDLKIKDIKNLEEILREHSSKIMAGKLGGGRGVWHQKILTGTINGINTVFTFIGEEPAQYSERVFLNYIEQNPVNGDYMINYKSKTVTYAVAPDISLSGYPHIIRYHS